MRILPLLLSSICNLYVFGLPEKEEIDPLQNFSFVFGMEKCVVQCVNNSWYQMYIGIHTYYLGGELI